MSGSSRIRPYFQFLLSGFMDWMDPRNPESVWHRNRDESPNRMLGFDVWCAMITQPQVVSLPSTDKPRRKPFIWFPMGRG
jgi:hypothetical protein